MGKHLAPTYHVVSRSNLVNNNVQVFLIFIIIVMLRWFPVFYYWFLDFIFSCWSSCNMDRMSLLLHMF